MNCTLCAAAYLIYNVSSPPNLSSMLRTLLPAFFILFDFIDDFFLQNSCKPEALAYLCACF